MVGNFRRRKLAQISKNGMAWHLLAALAICKSFPLYGTTSLRSKVLPFKSQLGVKYYKSVHSKLSNVT